MKLRRKTQISVQTERLVIVRKRKPPFFEVCAECGAALMSPEKAALVLGKTIRDVYREIENGTLNFTEIAGGELLVCCNSPQQKI